MKLPEQDILETQATEAISACFSDVPFCKLKWGRRRVSVGDLRVDRVGKLVVEGEADKTILLEVKRDGQPRTLRQAAYALRRYNDSFKEPYAIIFAPFISDASAELLSKEDVGYADLAGNCRIAVGKIYIRRSGQSNRFTEKRDLRSLYSPKGERILRVLMNDPKKDWLVKPLSEAAGVSLGQVSNVKKLLEGREWLTSGERGFRLKRPESLLEEWSKAYKFSKNLVSEFYAMASTSEIERAIGGKNEGPSRGVLTSFSASTRYAPVVRYQKVTAYVKGRVGIVAEELGWKRVSSGGNVLLLEPYDSGVFIGSRTVGGVDVVSPIQAYLDVQGNAGRGSEAAEGLLREVLSPSW